jgi:hypothetical protein
MLFHTAMTIRTYRFDSKIILFSSFLYRIILSTIDNLNIPDVIIKLYVFLNSFVTAKMIPVPCKNNGMEKY